MHSRSTDDYLKAIFELSEIESPVSTSALARRLDVAPASVTGMLRRLSTLDPPQVEYEKHRGGRLTPSGRARAVEMIRHHRLIETFLHDTLGYSWDEVHAEAEQLEHVISETLEDRISAQLGDPTTDPHGHPIPRKDGTIPATRDGPLATLEVGEPARVSRVPDHDADLLKHLAQLGLVPGVRFTVRRKDPYDGPVTVRTDADDEDRVLGAHAAAVIFVRPAND
jgi:DtxR family Mn-dependent transcriptional regulator